MRRGRGDCKLLYDHIMVTEKSDPNRKGLPMLNYPYLPTSPHYQPQLVSAPDHSQQWHHHYVKQLVAVM